MAATLVRRVAAIKVSAEPFNSVAMLMIDATALR
jgi:hypothetical protein